MARQRDKSDSAAPLGYLITWTTYGTWLPGDPRGWVLYGEGWKMPDPIREIEAKMRCSEDACILDPMQRQVVEQCVADHCDIRDWTLHAVNCRTNHCHAVITAPVHPDIVRKQLKTWATRRLKELERTRQSAQTSVPPMHIREEWWAERGSCRWIWNEDRLEGAILYVRDGQDRPRE